MNDLERTKEKLNRYENMILQVMERLQVLEMDNVKAKAEIEKLEDRVKDLEYKLDEHINQPDAHRV